jgi:hypothetical protein
MSEKFFFTWKSRMISAWELIMKKKLPIGLSDFKRLIKDDFYYVDKSLFIKEIIDSSSIVTLLPRPRRFGKTLNLSMLRYFFEKTAENTGCLFWDLAIWRQGEKYTDLQGRYPVIYLTFKDVTGDKWPYCYGILKEIISKEYERHNYVLNAELLTKKEAVKYKKIVDLKAKEFDYGLSLKELSEYLERYYQKKVIILIDEYDAPIQSGFVHGYYPEIIGFMRNLLSGAFKDNSSLEKGVLTGILRIAKESIFSGLNNLEVHSLLSHKYSTHFGLLENEVEEMLKYYEIGLEIDKVKHWYNGYVFGEKIIYNPWSIINYADNRQEGLLPYWVNTSSNDLVQQIITRSGREVKEDLERLIRGDSITKIVDDNIVFGKIEKNADTVWSFLLFSGYLKATAKELKNKRLYCELKIPNLEVEYLYEEIILSWFKESIDTDKLNVMLKGLVSGDLETFEDIFREYLLKTFSYFDTGFDEPEKVYHAFVLGLLVSLDDTYEVKSNRESGYGRYDVMLIPKDTTQKGIIIEFKKVNRVKKETLEEAANAALAQIDRKEYEQELRERGVHDLIKLGIAFEGKEVLLKSK